MSAESEPLIVAPAEWDLSPFDIEHQTIDEAERALGAMPQVHVPTEHAWVFGFYVRKVVLPAGMILVTKTHGQLHAFTVTRGRCIVRGIDGIDHVIQAPFVGITQPGERRRIFVEEETEWVTFQHPPSDVLETVVKNIEDAIMIPREGAPIYRDALNRESAPSLTE